MGHSVSTLGTLGNVGNGNARKGGGAIPKPPRTPPCGNGKVGIPFPTLPTLRWGPQGVENGIEKA